MYKIVNPQKGKNSYWVYIKFMKNKMCMAQKPFIKIKIITNLIIKGNKKLKGQTVAHIKRRH